MVKIKCTAVLSKVCLFKISQLFAPLIHKGQISLPFKYLQLEKLLPLNYAAGNMKKKNTHFGLRLPV